MKVLFAINLLIQYKSILEKSLPSPIELIFPEIISEETLLEIVPDVDVLVGYQVSKALLEKATSLKHIQLPWTGSERLNFELLREYPHITVSNSHTNALVIAEHAMALIFDVAKRITYGDRYMRRGDWTPRYESDNGYIVSGKTLGTLGYGAIAQEVARMAKNAFNMKVFAIKRNPENAPRIECNKLGGPENLHEMLQEADIVLVAAPLTSETRGLIGATELALMKRTAILVNIARGVIIQESALYKALKEKHIAGAGIDVWYNYPTDRTKPVNQWQNFPFQELDNLVMTPHSAFKVENQASLFTEDTIENIKRIYRKEEPVNQLNLELGY